jgi:hypothetical protein
MSYADWLTTNTSLRGKPFSFNRYPFQRAIVDDMHPNLDVIKCSQIGLTEIQIRKALAFLVRNRGTRLIFSLPNEELFSKVSQTRIKPIVDKDSVFNSEVDAKAVRSKSIMQFGESFLYITGCTEGDATSTSADAVFNDEVDLSPQDILALFNSRLQDSDWKINHRFSTPTFPEFGIDRSYNSSDQHHYLVRCDHCRHWNWPVFNRAFCVIPGLPDYVGELTEIDETFVHDLDLEGAYVCCEKCRAKLDLADPDKRQWVAKYAGRSKLARGYHVTPFSTSRLPISYLVDQLIRYKRRNNIRGFYNTVLGMPYSDGNIRLEESSIKACMTGQFGVPEVSRDAPCRVGIDMGQTCHITLGTGTDVLNTHIFLFEAVPVERLPARIEELDKRYNIVAGCIDRHPYTPTADQIRDMTQGRIMPVEYRGTQEVAIVKDKFENISHAQVNRTIHLDDLAVAVRKGAIKFSGYGVYQQTIIDHLRDMVRDEQPEKEAEWKKLTGQDHFFHAAAFLTSSYKVRELHLQVEQDELREMALVSAINLPKDKTALQGKYLDKGHLGAHNLSGTIGVF